jgi:hypothetical protein
MVWLMSGKLTTLFARYHAKTDVGLNPVNRFFNTVIWTVIKCWISPIYDEGHNIVGFGVEESFDGSLRSIARTEEYI